MVDMAMSELKSRSDIAIEDTWDLSTMYVSDDAWEAAASSVAEQVEAVTAFRGRFAEGPGTIRRALDAIYDANATLQRLVVYAALRKDEDQTDEEAMARYQRAIQVSMRAAEELSFVQPELVGLPEKVLLVAIASDDLQPYRFLLEDTYRQRAHVLSEEVETVLAQVSESFRAPGEAMSALDNADIQYGTVKDEDGNPVALTKGRFAVLQESHNRDVRREASEAYHKPYQDHLYTLTSLHTSSVKTDVARARVRGYESAQHQALFDDYIPVTVYQNLLQTVREQATPVIERYMELRRRALGVDMLRSYDLRVPLAPEPRRHYSYEEGKEIVLSGLGALGEQYVSDLRDGFDSRWVDVHETKGKRSGAYSWGSYGSPPVMLMNWNGTLNDVYTLAHEAGHSMHSFYSQKAQPIQYAGYSIFLAEIASTVNEVLLSWHLLGREEGQEPVQRFALLNRFADNYVGTVHRQTIFAEFEQQTHAMVEAGAALTPDILSALYEELFAAYTPGVEIDDSVRITWARIPHFYNAFYVYQYATGMSSAVNIATAVREEGDAARARDRYLEMLAAGGSGYPMDVLKRAVVDLETPAPIEAGVREFERVVAEMERLADDGVLEAAARAMES